MFFDEERKKEKKLRLSRWEKKQSNKISEIENCYLTASQRNKLRYLQAAEAE